MSDDETTLDPRTRRLLMEIGRAAIPPGVRVPPYGEESLDRLEAGLALFDPATRKGFLALATMVEGLSRATLPRGRSQERLRRVMRRLAESGRTGRLAIDGLLAPIRLAHFSDPEYFADLGCPFEMEPPADEPARWQQQVLSPNDVAAADLECDVAVVGSGAGGAVVACRLAEAGLAVLLLEEGGHFQRSDFAGRPVQRLSRMYRSMGVLPLHGNTRLTLPLGRTLGGSTTINSGTCYRTPDPVLQDWSRRLGLSDLAPRELAPYYSKVEQYLAITRCEREYWGGVAAVVIRGCETLGYAHAPVLRNAPECDGQATCAFGCPTGAKRSMDVSYIPRALGSGAVALVGAQVRRVVLDGGRASGVAFRWRTPAGGRLEATLKARAVVVAAGTVHTPGLLRRSGVSPAALGRNLTVHPAAMVMAMMDEPVRGWEGVPQSYAIEEFIDEGLIFEGGFTPPDLAAAMMGVHGTRFTELMDRYDHVAYFGAMIGDSSTGRVRSQAGAEPLLTYWLNAGDTGRLNRGVKILSRVFLAAGAREVIPMAGTWPSLGSTGDLDRLPRFGPGELDLTAFHPLGTARMGRDPATSVVDPDHLVHGMENVWVVDGSVLPSSLGVNPQLTIMAMAERAAERVRRRLPA